MWRLEIQPKRGAAWEPVLEFTPAGDTRSAWEYLAFLGRTCGLDYYAAQVYRR